MLLELERDAPPVLFGQLVAMRKRIKRPPRPKPVNGKVQRE